jgi:hypothetical protein
MCKDAAFSGVAHVLVNEKGEHRIEIENYSRSLYILKKEINHNKAQAV